MEFIHYEQLCNLNESELLVYNYVTAHMKQVKTMNIRTLAQEIGVSTTTILRFCSKVGCNGYKEFKYKLFKLESTEKSNDCKKDEKSYVIKPFMQVLEDMINNQELKQKVEEGAKLCTYAHQVIFIGMGASRTLGEYGVRLFSSVGVTSYIIIDPLYSAPTKSMEDTIVIALSVTGETHGTIALVDAYKKKGAYIISITNTEKCTLARISNMNFSYYMSFYITKMKEKRVATQIPVVYLLETLSYNIHNKWIHEK